MASYFPPSTPFVFDILGGYVAIASTYLALPTDELPEANDGEALKCLFKLD